MNLFVLTGAGLSAESGLRTFRQAADALWGQFDPYELATPEAFARDPARVHEFYNLRRRAVREASPNAAHVALARLGEELRARGGSLFLCTQNVDDLHARAGSADAVAMHGQLLQARCLGCGTVMDWQDDLRTATPCPACRAPRLRPNVVWFGEAPQHLPRIAEALRRADLFVAIGSSGAVYPAAGFVAEARTVGVPTTEINLEPADNSALFDRALYGLATRTVPAWVEAVLCLPDDGDLLGAVPVVG